MGGHNCFTFSISPDYLLKVSYVSHRSKGKASDVNTYQRMLTKARLNKIRDYINDDGIFRRILAQVVLQTPAGERIARVGRGEAVTVTGEPQELLLFIAGRDAVRVEFDGDAGSVAAVRAAPRGL